MSAQAVRAPISPQARDIRGPSAFGGGFRRFCNLTWMIAVTEYRLTYFGSALGYLWSLMRPLLMFGVLYVVFSQILRFGGAIKDYPVLLLFNVVLFSFFTEATQRSVNSVILAEGIVRKMQFPRMVIPLSTVLTAAINLVLNLVAVFVFLVIYGVNPMWSWLALPVILVPLIALTAGVSMLLSSLYVRFRDVAPIWMVASTMLFYGTPVLYAVNSIPTHAHNFQRLVMLNPLADILQQGRHWIVDPSTPSAVTVIGGWGWFAIPVAIFVLACVAGVWVFNHEAPRIAERL